MSLYRKTDLHAAAGPVVRVDINRSCMLVDYLLDQAQTHPCVMPPSWPFIGEEWFEDLQAQSIGNTRTAIADA